MAYERRSVTALHLKVFKDRWPASGPPVAHGMARGERGTRNHQWLARAVGLLAGATGYVQLCLDWYAYEVAHGHMQTEQMSPSHCQHHYAAHAAILIWAVQNGNGELARAAYHWFGVELALCKRFSVPAVRRGSVVAPGSRGWGGWKPGDVPSAQQHSWLRDEWTRYADKDRPFKGEYTPGLDAETVDLLCHSAIESRLIRGWAATVDLSMLVLAAPIYERTVADVIVRWWDPPVEVTNTRPTVYEAQIAGKQDSYVCLPVDRNTTGAKQIGVEAG